MALLTLALGLVLGAALAGLYLRGRPRAHAEPAPSLENGAMGMFLLRDSRIQWVNARCAKILGADAETLKGAGTRAFHQDDATYERFTETVQAMEADGEVFRGERRLRRVDGSPFWAFLTGSRVQEGHPEAGSLWFLEDVTERMEAQLDLAEVLSLNQRLIAASPTGIALYRAADGACVLANEAAARIVNARKEDLLRQNFRRIPSWKESGLREAAERALDSGLEQRLDCHFTTSYGRELWAVAQFVPFVSRGERLVLLLLDDVSEKMEASLALRASEEKYRAVADALNEGLALVDMQGYLTFCNSRLAEMGGFPAEAILGQHYSTFVPGTELAALQERRILQQAVASETLEVGIRRGDGTIMEARVSLASVQGGQGVPVALAILVTDISMRNRVERERERLLGELEQKNKELETLLYVASHDLRSPLVNIQGFSQRLAKALDELGRHQEKAASMEEFRAAVAPLLQDRMPASLEFIRASGAKMDAIINGLLTLSRAGRMVLRAETLDMNALLKACSATLAFQFQSVDGTLVVDDLPSCVADPVQVTQILSNLLDNAIKYRHRDRPLVVRVSGSAGPGIAVYTVEDNGVGIAPEHRERIWEIFQRLDPQGPIPGDGLGLTLVRRMAERNGGRIRVESAPENGCRFFLELPVPSS